MVNSITSDKYSTTYTFEGKDYEELFFLTNNVRIFMVPFINRQVIITYRVLDKFHTSSRFHPETSIKDRQITLDRLNKIAKKLVAPSELSKFQVTIKIFNEEKFIT